MRPELWLEVKDNDYYERRLRELSCFAPPVLSIAGIDAIIRESFIQPMIEQLNRPSYLLNTIAPEVVAPTPPPKRRWRIFGWFR